jgi:hypothetical protein
LIAPETPLLYNTEEDECELLNGNDDDFRDSKFVAVGSVFSQEENTLHVLTPYFVKISIDPVMNRNEKVLVNKIKKDVLRIVKPVTKRIHDGAVRLMSMTDVDEVKQDVRAVGYGIQELQQFIDWNGECSVPEIFIQQTLGIIDGDELKLIIGGFGPQYYFNFIPKDYAREAQNQCSYSQMSLDDFMKKAKGEEAMQPVKVEQKSYGDEQEDENECPDVIFTSYKTLCEEHKNLSLLEFYVPVVIDILQD